MQIKRDTEAAFKEAYASLNAAQKQAVDAIDGPVLVVAGPGTGKTQILAHRIANILLKTDVKANNILALTFTESGARAMRERLSRLIGEAAYDINIYTFHGFSDQLIKRYPEAYPRIIGGRAASEIERITILETILEDKTFKALRPSGDPLYYLKPLRSAISDLKQEYLRPDEFAKRIIEQERALADIPQYHEKGAHKGKERGEYKDAVKYLERNQELLHAYRLYDAMLKDKKLYDFDDMIVETVSALSNNTDILRDVQEQYQYVLADEHQDVNGSQNKILELIVNFHDRPNIFAVGDEKQAIYRFQGASLDNFLYFEDAFPGTQSISLIDNYRSGQRILDAAQNLIQTDDVVLAKLRTPLTAKAVETASVSLHTFSHEASEVHWIVSSIKECIDSGMKANEIAVIVRTNRAVEAMSIALKKAGIAAAASADSDILEHPIVRSIDVLLQAVNDPTNDFLLTTLLHEPWFGVPYADVARILISRSRATPLAVLLSDEEKLNSIGVENSTAVTRIISTLERAKKETITQPPHRVLESLLHESGLLSHVLLYDPVEGAPVLRRLYDEVEGMVRRKEVTSLADVSRQISLHREHGVPLNAPFVHTSKDAVQVMTAHKSKGLEFGVVYIPQLTDSMWGKKSQRSLFELPIVRHDVGDFDVIEDDERRLLYVAMTRAKHTLHVSYGLENVEGKEQTPSRFLTELDGSFVVEDMSSYGGVDTVLDSLSPLPHESITTAFMLETIEKRGVSPTALNNFLKSPWEFLYKNVLHAPQVKSTELQYGSAIHYVLDQMIQRKEHSDSFIASELRTALSKEALHDDEFTRLHERGFASLVVYRDTLLQSATSESKTEVHLEGEIETGIESFPILRLTGTLDRVDSKNGEIIRVVDYKTGKPKTRNHIEGKTADSNGDYKRQLVFYALLLSLQSDSAKHCRTGTLSFVESDKNGEIREETFEITDSEIEVLKEELLTMVRKIVEGTALDVACDPEVCNYCELIQNVQEKRP